MVEIGATVSGKKLGRSDTNIYIWHACVCAQYNGSHNPGKLSRKAEYEET